GKPAGQRAAAGAAAHDHEIECIRHACPPLGYFCGGDSAFAPFLARAVPRLIFAAKTRGLAVTKSSKPGLLPFPKQVGVDTYPSHPLAMPGLPSQEAFGTVRLAPRRWPVSFPVRLFERRAR